VVLKKILYTILVVNLFILASCGGKPKGKSEGIIEYKVTYPKMDKSNFMLDFMPKKMTMKFKDDKYMTSLSAGMGMFKTNFICDQEEERFTQMVKLINKKYALQLEGDAIAASLLKLPKFHIEFTNEQKKILNYTCKKAIITVDNESNDAFSVYYTDQINIENPNWCNQFDGINGVMLEYQYEKYDVCMKFNATKIKFTEIGDDEFVIDKKYKHISEVQMDKEMMEIFASFN
jgi:GLPGLI family protein